ncbi:MAG TPA: radical SAM protein [Chthoniobacterales bacterium]|nr:radical SAM protein [Chthoniobacterales bacterium]
MTVEFAGILDNLPLEQSETVRTFRALIAPKDNVELDRLAVRARALTLQHFGRTMRLFAPLYLSNECINSCRYCGFSRENPILRVTLLLDEVVKEARHLAVAGFRQLLLVAGEHPKFVSRDYLADCVRVLRDDFSSISIEVAPMETEDYIPIVEAGGEGLVVYQETYNRAIYDHLHLAGPKKDFAWRLACPERGYDAGFRRIGIGALLGLAPWREEAIALAAHLEYLLKRCWKSSLTVSVPRLRPAAGEFRPRFPISDRDLVHLVCALRVAFPQVGIVLSTREPAVLRDLLIQVGVTMMSAGSHTEPGGYTGQGREKVHLTVRGRAVVPPDVVHPTNGRKDDIATAQFEIGDSRSPQEIAAVLRRNGIEPVWKDWDAALIKR